VHAALDVGDVGDATGWTEIVSGLGPLDGEMVILAPPEHVDVAVRMEPGGYVLNVTV